MPSGLTKYLLTKIKHNGYETGSPSSTMIILWTFGLVNIVNAPHQSVVNFTAYMCGTSHRELRHSTLKLKSSFLVKGKPKNQQNRVLMAEDRPTCSHT